MSEGQEACNSTAAPRTLSRARHIYRISSSRLYEFAKVLDVSVSYFFDEMPSNALSCRPMSGRGCRGSARPARRSRRRDLLIKRETLELVRAYDKIGQGSGGIRSRQAFGGPPQTIASTRNRSNACTASDRCSEKTRQVKHVEEQRCAARGNRDPDGD